ncbi:hypothetical protein LXL04_017063 [Taraxacum kok-saghyz]
MSAATGDQPSTSSSTYGSQPCRRFEFTEILSATDNFNESLVVGRGGFGKVYKGEILNGSTLVLAAIKRLDSMSNQGEEEFRAEVEMLSKLRHSHLVSLFGYCNYESEKILVSLFGYCNYETEKILIYEYMPNGTLEDHLHKLGTHLSWLQRLKICIGAARGLDYLHTGTGIETGVIHRDVKTSNILLHESWAAKISDFGLSRVAPTNQQSTYVNTLVKGTFGYFDPNYFATGRLTRKSDVYAFGVVLFEVLCRKRAVDKSLDDEQWGLVSWAQDSIKAGNLKQITDSSIRGEISTKCLKGFVRIAERCLLFNPKQRPTMAEVVVSLDSLLILQQKIDSSLQATGKTVFGRVLDMLPFPSNEESSARKNDIGAISDGVVVFAEELEVHLGQLRRFSVHELQVATDEFGSKNILGVGGFGEVYKGRLADGSLVAVKRFIAKGQDAELCFQTVVEMTSMVVHQNLLRLRGFCMTPTERFLVYPYMANGSVASCLRGRRATEPVLGWPVRKHIALGVAKGLGYLHDHDPEIIHRYVKAANIFLDEDFQAFVGDFGLARLKDYNDNYVTTYIRGTVGHLAPEYLITGKLTEKNDVYGYGVMLLELITGQHGYDLYCIGDVDEVMLLDWVKGILRDKKLETLVDADLHGAYVDDEVEQLIKLALLCTQETASKRPKMSEVVKMLEGDGGLSERWEEWQKEELFRQEFDTTDNPYLEWSIADSTCSLSDDEFSSPR